MSHIVTSSSPAPSSFVHLHLHTTYSLLDGAQKIGDIHKPHKDYGVLNLAKEYGMPAVAMTDHGNMFGALDFYKKAIAAGIKPILGCELYITKDRFNKSPNRGEKATNHLLVLAKNYEGYRNLCKLVTRGYFEGFYYRPRIDKVILRQFSKGLIGTSSCLAGEICQHLLLNRFEEALASAKEYSEIFEGRFYIELQDNGMEAQYRVNPLLIKIAEELKLPLVATNDVHYLRQEDACAQDVLMCISTKKTVHDKNRLKHDVDQFYLKTPTEMWNAFSDYPEACANTLKIAEECNVELPLNEYHFPRILDAPQGITNEEYMTELSQKGLESRLEFLFQTLPQEKQEETRKEYQERLDFELDVIKKMGFCDYFVIVADFINWAKDQDIPVGPGRGSAAGSLVAYSLRITDIDPIRHALLFERFLNPERISMPDIDIDFCEARREEVIEYVRNKYAVEDGHAVAQIITFGTLKAKAAVRDVGRALGIEYKEVDKIAKLIPNSLGITLKQALEQEPQLPKLMKESHQINQLMELAIKLEGLNRHASIHAAGLVISDGVPLDDYLPLYRGANGEVVTQFDMKGVETIGLIKFDFLGLKNLTLIKNCLQLVEKNRNIKIPLDRIDLEDPLVYKLLQKGDTIGVFQLESSGMRQLMMRLKPSCFDDVIALVALYRPGPLQSGMADSFIRRKHGDEKITYEFPQLEPIMKSTYGVCIYQEQVMQIANILASYSLGEADLLRRAMGKKIAEEMAQQRVRFLEGAERNQLDAKKAGEIFDIMEKFAEYGFNRSHSAAYGLIAYQTAWLKAHYPAEYMAALLTADSSNTDKILLYIGDSRAHQINIRPPDVNFSEKGFTVVQKDICFGLGGLKGVGESAIEAIVESRDPESPYKNLYDFCERADLRRVNKKVLEVLIKAGAFDGMGATRSAMSAVMEEAMSFGQRVQKEKSSNQISLFGAAEVDLPTATVPDLPEWNEKELLAHEKSSLGIYLSGHPLERYASDIKRLTSCSISNLKEKSAESEVTIAGMITACREVVTRKGKKMAILTLEDLTGEIEIPIFPGLYEQASPFLDSDEPLLVRGKIEKEEEQTKLIPQTVISLTKARADKAKSVHLQLVSTDLTSRVNDMLEIFRKHEGNCPTYFHVTIPHTCEVTLQMPESFSLDPTESLVDDLESFFGFNPIYFR